MNKILYVVDNNGKNNYHYKIDEDTVIYHFSIDGSSEVILDLIKEGVSLKYYYSNINYNNNSFSIRVNHKVSNTNSELYNHGVNVFDKKLDYYVDGVVLKKTSGCVCNQENQIINLRDGKSTICPNLLIDNYDVVSNHSAYIGKFSDDKLFYLMSRGISLKDAYKLLLNGFLINSKSLDLEKVKLFLEEIDKI